MGQYKDQPVLSAGLKIKKYLNNHTMELFVMNILLLIINLFIIVMQGSQRPVDLWMFDSIMDKEANGHFNGLLRTFTTTMEKHNITYFMYQGTLLGSYRHHGHVLWDDDLDFMLHIEDKGKVKDIIKNMGKRYSYYDKSSIEVMKLFYRKSPDHSLNAPEMDVTWPNIDISFYLENETHIWDPAWDWQGFNYPKTEVFPLTLRPFDGLILPAPNNPERILKRSYDINWCRTHSFSHRWVAVIPYFLTAEKPCDALRNRMPFVNRFKGNCSITERLQIYGWTTLEYNASLPNGQSCDA